MEQDVSTWLANCDPGFITSFISFQAKAAPFPGSYFSAEVISISPHTQWKGAAVCGVGPALASIKRVFSFIHKIRNQLGIQKQANLSFVTSCYVESRTWTDKF